MTLTTESLGSPVAVAGRKTLPGNAASEVFELTTRPTMVLSRLALQESD